MHMDSYDNVNEYARTIWPYLGVLNPEHITSAEVFHYVLQAFLHVLGVRVSQHD